MVVTLGQQYNIGEKPTVILYTYMFIPNPRKYVLLSRGVGSDAQSYSKVWNGKLEIAPKFRDESYRCFRPVGRLGTRFVVFACGDLSSS